MLKPWSPPFAQWVPSGSQRPLSSRSHRSHRSWAAPPAQASGGVSPRPPDRPGAGDAFRTGGPHFYGRFGKSENMGVSHRKHRLGKCRLIGIGTFRSEWENDD